MWANFDGMPKLLKCLTAHVASCFVLLAISVIPIDLYALQGRHVTYAEWWTSGAGVLASVLGIVGPFAAWAIASKKTYARAVYLGFLALAFVEPWLFIVTLAYVLTGLLFVGLGAFYMYKWQSVLVYFAPNQSFEPTSATRLNLRL